MDLGSLFKSVQPDEGEAGSSGEQGEPATCSGSLIHAGVKEALMR